MLVVLVVLVAVVLLGLLAAVDSRLRGNDGLGAVKRRSASQAEAQAQAKKTKMPATSYHAGREPLSGCRAHECWLSVVLLGLLAAMDSRLRGNDAVGAGATRE